MQAFTENLKATTEFLVFDGPEEQIECVLDLASQGKIQFEREFFPSTASFAGRAMNTWQEVKEAVDGFDEQAVSRVEEFAQVLATELPEPESLKRKQSWNDAGGEFYFDRFMDGNTCFRDTKRRVLAGTQFVTLFVDLGAHCGVRHESLLWRGATCLALSSILEMAGYSTEIIGYTAYGRQGSKQGVDYDCVSALWLKRTEEELCLSVLANVASPWYFRTVILGSCSAVAGARLNSGLGYPFTLSDRSLPLLHGFPQDVCLHVHDVLCQKQAEELGKRLLGELANRKELIHG